MRKARKGLDEKESEIRANKLSDLLSFETSRYIVKFIWNFWEPVPFVEAREGEGKGLGGGWRYLKLLISPIILGVVPFIM
jgi:hypothetical protein